jgi:hypothetical protein
MAKAIMPIRDPLDGPDPQLLLRGSVRRVRSERGDH